MADVSRRRFIVRSSLAAGVLAAGAGGLTVVSGGPGVGGTRPTARPPSPGLAAAAARGPMVVHVRDVGGAEVALMVGTREIVYRDPQLVAGIMHAASQAGMER